MKSLFNKYIWLQLILSILLLFGGTITIVFAFIGKQNILEDGLNIITAVILFLFGGFAILASFAFESEKAFTNGLLYGSGCIALGVFLCTRDLVLLNYIVMLLSIFFIVIGTIEVLKGIILIIKKVKLLIIILTFVFATIFIAGGILALIYRENIKIAFCVIAGALLFIAGVYELVVGIRAMIAQSKAKPKKNTRKITKKEEKQEIKEIDYTTEK